MKKSTPSEAGGLIIINSNEIWADKELWDHIYGVFGDWMDQGIPVSRRTL